MLRPMLHKYPDIVGGLRQALPWLEEEDLHRRDAVTRATDLLIVVGLQPPCRHPTGRV